MSFQFSKHYTIDEARVLLPSIQKWFAEIDLLQTQLIKLDVRLTNLASSGNDVGGETVNSSVKARAKLQSILMEFHSRGIEIKDLERGLVDFPALRDGKEIFLCWEKGEDNIEYWHDVDSGFSGRERLD